MAVVLLDGPASFSGSLALDIRATLQFMVFSGTLRGRETMHASIGVHIGEPVGPCAVPRCVVDDHRVRAPVKVPEAEAPRPEECANRHAKPEVDGAAHHKTPFCAELCARKAMAN